MEKRNDEAREKAVRIYTVCLEGMEFFAYHGCREDEKINGNSFSVDFEGEFASPCAQDDDLDKTVNYGKIYGLIASVMNGERCNLMETLAARCTDAISASFPALRKFKITISKKNPPVSGVCARSRIALEWKRENE